MQHFAVVDIAAVRFLKKKLHIKYKYVVCKLRSRTLFKPQEFTSFRYAPGSVFVNYLCVLFTIDDFINPCFFLSTSGCVRSLCFLIMAISDLHFHFFCLTFHNN